ncbi:ribosome-binding protein 1-like [Pollicipes pollicipes]|uniref:ribosome-binding protein 1-like n=1 Tax=Pollicipes pollicipes TaxID=41117 RepID=UPI001884AB78|nr:ribosome-binding protein 1-like [Pollicipes pollicipes]
MGADCSRCAIGRRKPAASSASHKNVNGATRVAVGDAAPSEDEQEEAMRLLREEFKQRPTVFLLSQIILAVQFFKNFDRDRRRTYELKQKREDELNKTLKKDRKAVIYLGSPYEVIGEVIEYSHSDNDEPSLGHDLEYLIVHDSISVRGRFDEPEENDATDYQFVMQKCRNEGYVRLQLEGRSGPAHSTVAPNRPGSGNSQKAKRTTSTRSDRDQPTAAQRAQQTPQVNGGHGGGSGSDGGPNADPAVKHDSEGPQEKGRDSEGPPEKGRDLKGPQEKRRDSEGPPEKGRDLKGPQEKRRDSEGPQESRRRQGQQATSEHAGSRQKADGTRDDDPPAHRHRRQEAATKRQHDAKSQSSGHVQDTSVSNGRAPERPLSNGHLTGEPLASGHAAGRPMAGGYLPDEGHLSGDSGGYSSGGQASCSSSPSDDDKKVRKTTFDLLVLFRLTTLT